MALLPKGLSDEANKEIAILARQATATCATAREAIEENSLIVTRILTGVEAIVVAVSAAIHAATNAGARDA